MNENVISVANDFYPRPSGRYLKDGQYTGEAFRNRVLIPRLQEIKESGHDEALIVDFSDVTMAGSSFLEEAFGGLVRTKLFTKDFLKKVLIIKSPRRPVINDRIELYIKEA
ncbi:STAS-like domain-containing protein [Acinetobacter pittii]|uniref:STAS-like domain-containing protein n=1 Tax=Acinetobacter pittii TaxID=48296 RepID=UPI00325FEB90